MRRATAVVAETARFEACSTLTPPYGGLLERRGSKLGLLKSIFNAENFACKLSWFISGDFGAIQFCNVCCRLKSRKIH